MLCVNSGDNTIEAENFVAVVMNMMRTAGITDISFFENRKFLVPHSSVGSNKILFFASIRGQDTMLALPATGDVNSLADSSFDKNAREGHGYSMFRISSVHYDRNSDFARFEFSKV